MKSLLRSQGPSLLWLVFTLVVPLTMSGILTALAASHESWLRAIGADQWALIYLIASAAMGMALVPTTFVALASGYLLGWAALLPMAISYLLASLLGFYISRMIDNDQLLKFIEQQPKASAALARLKARQRSLVIFGRISPVLPFAMMNLVLPALGVRLWPFLWAGFLGMLPRTIMVIWLGSQAYGLKQAVDGEQGDPLFLILTVALTVLSLIGLTFIAKKVFSGR